MNIEEKLIFLFSLISSKLINLNKNPLKNDYQNILIVKLDEIGDVVTASHVFEIIKNQYPEAKITLWCKPFIKDLLRKNPFIDVIITDYKDLRGGFDLMVDLRGNWRSIFYAILHPPKYRVDRGAVRLKNKYDGGQRHEVNTNLQIIEPVVSRLPDKPILKIYFDEEDTAVAKNFLEENKISRFALIHCGARKPLRKWKEENFIAIANYLKKEKELDVVFVGDRFDQLDIEPIQKQLKFQSYSIAGKFNLLEFAAMCDLSEVFIGNESGPMHIASTTRTKVIGLFGPGVPTTFYPYGENSHYLHRVLKCNPCDQVHCVQPENPCIDMISVSEVTHLLESLVH